MTNFIPMVPSVYTSLRGSPLDMEVYTFLTDRTSFMQRRCRSIAWESLRLDLPAVHAAVVAALAEAERTRSDGGCAKASATS